ncbi:MAG: c-type cytochrome [Armatimonadetes bacterium]|nr:c-type cytochrome [Armatimonadota bacterium]NIM23434.1 c-type cytochrome [Armatimonadota bacterium]NIM67299.1 c-type cytochrome [Armatimonadota bacterium]NIM75797.1 c-type cytochrome [Armatimonadota bacterium]NIN05485.1 c-type cytochrome [Armatimonadota bacterium]
MVGKILRWIDEQTELVTFVKEFMEEPLAKGVGWPHVFGSAAMFLFVVQLCTGVLLMVYYVPSPDAAYESASFISRELPLGGLVRGLHHWGASFMLILVIIHMLQAFFWGAYKKPRQIIWVIGVLLLLVTMGLSFTGYLLPWDQKAYWATVVGTRIAGSVPMVGHYITALFRGGPDVGALTLTRFFALHVLIFPAVLIGLMVFHVAQVRKKGITPPWRRVDDEDSVSRPTLFYPDQVFKDAVVSVLLLGLLFAVAVLYPAHLEAKANPAAIGYVPRPEWYFLPNFELLKYVPTAWGEWGEFAGAAVVPGLAVLFLIVLPYLDRNPERLPRRRPLISVGAVAALGVLLYLGISGAKSGPPHAQLTPQQQRGQKVFLDLRCHSCHGINGGGGLEGQDLGPDGPRQPDTVAKVLRSPTAINPRSIMPPVPASLTKTDFQDLVAFVSAIDTTFRMPTEVIASQPHRPSSHQEENWFANHKYEVRKDPTLCGQCHEPTFCQSCHLKRRPDSHEKEWLKSHFGTAQERPEYCQVCHEENYCNSCHDRLMHTEDWMQRHSSASEVDREMCQECHKPDFCITCHGGTKPASHTKDWVYRHQGAQAAECSECHNTKTFCTACHEGARPESHKADWLTQHPSRAESKTKECATCHRTEFCSSCHGGIDLPHPPDWMLEHKAQASFAAGSVCFRCHEYNETCNKCHGAEMPEPASDTPH